MGERGEGDGGGVDKIKWKVLHTTTKPPLLQWQQLHNPLYFIQHYILTPSFKGGYRAGGGGGGKGEGGAHPLRRPAVF